MVIKSFQRSLIDTTLFPENMENISISLFGMSRGAPRIFEKSNGLQQICIYIYLINFMVVYVGKTSAKVHKGKWVLNFDMCMIFQKIAACNRDSTLDINISKTNAVVKQASHN